MREYAAQSLSPSELTVIRQVRTLFEVFDKGLQTLLAQPSPATARDSGLNALTPRRRITDTPLEPSMIPQHGPTHVVYRVKDGRTRDPRGVSERDLQVYRTIQATHAGVSRKELLRRLHAQTHTGIVDGAVRRLRLKKLILAERRAA